MKAWGRQLKYGSTIIDLGTRCRWVVSFISGRFIPDTHWRGAWVGPIAGLDALEKRKIFSPARNRTPDVQPVARHYTRWAIPTHTRKQSWFNYGTIPAFSWRNWEKPQTKPSVRADGILAERVPVIWAWKCINLQEPGYPCFTLKLNVLSIYVQKSNLERSYIKIWHIHLEYFGVTAFPSLNIYRPSN
jgi:hypothetical protein